MTPPILQATRNNLGWSIKKSPITSTTIASHVSGRKVRVRNWAYPLYSFELTFSGLASNGSYPGLGRDSLQQLMGLFTQVGGQSDAFLYTDATDCRVTGQPLGVGDGSTTTFNFQRALNNYPAEPVGFVTYVSAVYVGGAAQASNWALSNPTQGTPYPYLQFTSAPASGAQVTADFNYAFVCCFDDDTLEFEQFMDNLWQAQSVKFRSLRGGGF